MRMCGDWLFWIKLCKSTHIGFVNRNLNFIRNHSDMTRNHSSKTKKRDRLLEEVSLRNYMYNKCAVKSEEMNENVYKSWANIHKWNAIFSTNFYDIILDSSSKTALIKTSLLLKFKLLLKK